MAKTSTAQAVSPAIAVDSARLQHAYLTAARDVLRDISVSGAGYSRDRLRQWQGLHNQILSTLRLGAPFAGIAQLSVDGIWGPSTAINILGGSGLMARLGTFRLESNPSLVKTQLTARTSSGATLGSAMDVFLVSAISETAALISRAEGEAASAVAASNATAERVIDTTGHSVPEIPEIGPVSVRPAALSPSAPPTVIAAEPINISGRTGPNWGLIIFGLAVLFVGGNWFLTTRKFGGKFSGKSRRKRGRR